MVCETHQAAVFPRFEAAEVSDVFSCSSRLPCFLIPARISGSIASSSRYSHCLPHTRRDHGGPATTPIACLGAEDLQRHTKIVLGTAGLGLLCSRVRRGERFCSGTLLLARELLRCPRTDA